MFAERSEQEEGSMNAPLRVGIIGDFDPRLRSHLATTEALCHAANALSVRVDTAWLPTPSLDHVGCETTLQQFDALWCAPASPYKSMQGALKAIQFAREQDWPFLGT
jgi:CTP synthase (UTP-ammonia lyase)